MGVGVPMSFIFCKKARPLSRALLVSQTSVWKVILINISRMNEFANDLPFIYVADVYNQWEKLLELTREENFEWSDQVH